MIRLQLLGPFRAYDEDGSPLITRSHRSLLAILGLARGKPVSRRDLMHAIWSDVPTEVAQNRLRVSLSSLRKHVGDSLTESDRGIAFATGSVASDLDEFYSELYDIENEVDQVREKQRLEALLAQMGHQLVSDMDDPWVEDYRLEWSQKVLQVLEHLIALAWKVGEYRLVAKAASTSFEHDPNSDDNWLKYLKSKVRLGESADAVREFAIARSKYQADSDSDFSEEVLDFAKQVRLGQYTFETEREGSLSQVELEFIGHMLEVYFEKDPGVIASFLGTTHYLQEQLKFSKASRLMVERLMPLIERGTLPWIRLHLARCESYGIMNDAREVLRMWDEVADCDVPTDLRVIYLNMTSFARFSLRDYEGAIADIEEAIELNRDNPAAADRLLTNKASVLWHTGDFLEADRLYDLSTHACESEVGDFYRIRTAVNLINQGFSRIMQGRLRESLDYLEEPLKVMQEHRQEAGMAMVFAAYGYVRYAVHDDRAALVHTCRGIKLSYHLKFERSQQIALDYAAAAFAHAGDALMARTVLDYATRWRQQTGHDFSVAEGMLRDRTLAQCASAPEPDPYLSKLEAPDVLCEIVKKLRAIALANDPVTEGAS